MLYVVIVQSFESTECSCWKMNRNGLRLDHLDVTVMWIQIRLLHVVVMTLSLQPVRKCNYLLCFLAQKAVFYNSFLPIEFRL